MYSSCEETNFASYADDYTSYVSEDSIKSLIKSLEDYSICLNGF